MSSYLIIRARFGMVWLALLFLHTAFLTPVHAAEPSSSAPHSVLQLVEGDVFFNPKGSTNWYPAAANHPLYPGDQLRTGDFSRAVIRWSNLTTERIGERSWIRVPEPERESAIIEFLRGIKYFFHRDKPGEFDVHTPRVSAVVRGTEFSLQVAEDGTTILTLYDGQVEMTNEFGTLHLDSGQEAVVQPNEPPKQTARIASINQIQWCLYYPAILHLDELNLTPAEQTDLDSSLRAYDAGDLLHALHQYPADREPISPSDRLYRAAILLAVGQVEASEDILQTLPENDPSTNTTPRIATALRQLIAAVTRQPFHRTQPPVLATEWLAESYYLQSESQLEAARKAARQALDVAPDSGFALARTAELEFGFGRIKQARQLAEQSVKTAPRNAQALALHGFLLSAENRIEEAISWFDRAIAADGALGNAWLGRGLCRIRQGQTAQGLDDIQVAATLEPQRALLRSYLGKTYSNTSDNRRALQEIQRAQDQDRNDPTAWLYAALVKQQENRINEAIHDLEHAQTLNENRSVFRSQLLLDQDRAVRSANLANVYADAGMDEVSLREAARSVNADYANFSGHLFLANSYSRLQDPGRINLRYETAAVSEYLVANLLAPVGAGALSPTVSQQEYSKLFEGEGLGIVSSTEYLSRGAWTQQGAHYGTVGNSSFSVDHLVRVDNGQRPNNDLDLQSISVLFKQQLSPSDQVFGQVLLSQSEQGDLAPYYDPDAALLSGGPNPFVRVEETQEPILLAGYQHRWAPGHHTLFLASRLDDHLEVDNPFQETLLVDKATGSGASGYLVGQDYESDLEIYSAEVQQIMQLGSLTFIGGGRYQFGEFESANQHTPVPGYPLFNIDPNDLVQEFDSDFRSGSAYLYSQFRVAPPVLLVAGVSYDYLKYPLNHRFAPLANGEESTDQVSPKVGIIMTPNRWATVRAAYSRSLGGVSFDQSFRLEPSQVAGINQAFRSVIPDAVTGANSAEEYDVFGLALDFKLPTQTYLGVAGGLLLSDVDRDFGVYDLTLEQIGPGAFLPATVPSETRQAFDYHESSFALTLNQLVSEEWSFGAAYRLSYADLEIESKELASSQEWEAYLHQVRLFTVLNHDSGFFSRAESLWFQQSNQGYTSDLSGDDFWHFNVYGGYRFLRRRAELTLGILNLTDQDYRLNPLNVTGSLPRDRTFFARFRFNF